MDLDLNKYRLEHVSIDDMEYVNEITQRVISKKPELFWMLRHVKDSTKNIMLMQLTDKVRERAYSHFMLAWIHDRAEMTKVLDGNAKYIERLETAIHGYKQIFSLIPNTPIDLNESFDRCPDCNGTQVYRGNDFCIDCGQFFDRCETCGELHCVCVDEGDGIKSCVKCGKGLKNGLCKEHDSIIPTESEKVLTSDGSELVKVCPECKAEGGTEHREGCSLIGQIESQEPVVIGVDFAKEGTESYTPCPTCGGSGIIHVEGDHESSDTCGDCDGTGRCP